LHYAERREYLEEGAKEKTIVMGCPDRTNEVIIELKLVE